MKIFFIVFIYLLPQEVWATTLTDLTYTTEEYPPLNYIEKGKVKGLAVDLLKLVWKDLDIPEQKIYLMPWARAYYDIQHKANLALFSTSKTKERLPLFQWACPIFNTNYALYALRSKKIKINSTNELKNYQIGTIRFDAAEQILMNEYNIKLNVVSNVSKAANLKMLKKDRIQLFAFHTAGANQLFTANGYEPKEFELVYSLMEFETCFAFSRNIDPELIRTFQTALSNIVRSDLYLQLLKKYEL